MDVERLEAAEIIGVRAEYVAMTGFQGALARKNETSAMGRAMGAASEVPAIVMQTLRGDLIFTFKPKHAGHAQEAARAVAALLGQRRS